MPSTSPPRAPAESKSLISAFLGAVSFKMGSSLSLVSGRKKSLVSLISPASVASEDFKSFRIASTSPPLASSVVTMSTGRCDNVPSTISAPESATSLSLASFWVCRILLSWTTLRCSSRIGSSSAMLVVKFGAITRAPKATPTAAPKPKPATSSVFAMAYAPPKRLDQVSLRLLAKSWLPPKPTMRMTAAMATRIPSTAHSQPRLEEGAL